MTRFGKYSAKPKSHPTGMGGNQWIFEFPNGYGASVIRTPYSYGGDSGLFELAVLGSDGRLDYSTPVTDDVLGHLSEADVADALARIEALENAA